MKPKTFEIDFNKHVYFGDYSFEDNKLVIDNVHTFDKDEQRVEVDSINDREVYQRIYQLVEKEKIDELNEDIEAQNFHSRLNDF